MLQISHLSADYGGKPALADINLTLDSGELLVVLGPSGCGKTTLLKAISARLAPQQGEVRYQQRSLYAMSEAERAASGLLVEEMA